MTRDSFFDIWLFIFSFIHIINALAHASDHGCCSQILKCFKPQSELRVSVVTVITRLLRHKLRPVCSPNTYLTGLDEAVMGAVFIRLSCYCKHAVIYVANGRKQVSRQHSVENSTHVSLNIQQKLCPWKSVIQSVFIWYRFKSSPCAQLTIDRITLEWWTHFHLSIEYNVS